MVSLLQWVSPKLYSLPPGSALLLSRICPHRLRFEPRIRFDRQIKIELELQYCIVHHDCKFLCSRQGRIFHFHESILLHEFLLHLETSRIFDMKVASLFLLVSQEYGSIVQSQLISNQLRNIVWITSGLRTIVRIFARVLAASFTVAVHWLEFLQW